MKTFTAKTLDDIPLIAGMLVNWLDNSRVVALHGGMGVGKTTLIKALCSYLGVTCTVNSPSFAIVNEYRDEKDNPIYHFDFYRINSPGELVAIGIDDYFESGHWCFIEWPTKAGNLLPVNSVNLFMTEEPDGSRVITADLPLVTND